MKVLEILQHILERVDETARYGEYSYNEVPVGKWVDGKTLYRKCFHITTTGQTNISIADLNVDQPVRAWFVTHNTTGSDYSLGSYVYVPNSSADNGHIYCVSNKKTLVYRCGSTYSKGDTYIAFEYTKTS